MTAAATTAAAPALPPPRRPRRRWLAAIAVVLMVAIPAGYLVLSGYQSRASGESKARAASADAMRYGWPTKLQRRIYDVPVPDGASYVGHYETNAWGRSSLYVQFRVSPVQLGSFLDQLGTSTTELREGVSLTERDTAATGWVLDDPDRTYVSTVVQHGPDRPRVAVTVDLTPEEQPRVYVASTSQL